jgi:hypothetical protein
MGSALAPFLAGWTAMMAAMMLPSALPMIRVFVGLVAADALHPRIRTGVFVAGYLLVWSAVGPRFTAFDVEDGQLPRVRAGGVELESEFIRNPVTKETVHPRLALPEGLVLKDAALIASSRFVVSEGPVRYDHSGRYAAHGFFQYFEP